MTEGQASHGLCHPKALRQTGRWPKLALVSPNKINGSGGGHTGACRAQAGGNNHTSLQSSAVSL